MTAIDTTNLRLTVTVPAHGMLRVRLMASLHGATTYPSILMGVMDGATVRGRVAPVQSLGNTAVATALVNVEADFTMTGLTPGSMTLDAAYAVETLVAATGLKYGGPNNTTANDAFGAFVFEIWDPRPMKLALDGGVNVTQYGGTAGTFAGGRPEVNVSHNAGTAITAAAGRQEVNVSHFGGAAGTFAAGRPEVNVTHWGGTAVATAVVLNAANIGADALTAAKIAADAGTEIATAVWASATRALTDKAGFNISSIDNNVITAAAIAADAGTELATAVWASAARTLTAGTNLPTDASIADAVWDELLAGHVGVGSSGLALTAAAISSGLDAAGMRAALGMASANLDTQLGTIAGYIDTEVGAIAAALVTVDGKVDAVKAKTDGLNFTVAGKVDVNVLRFNSEVVIGTGAVGDRWRALGT